MKKTLFTLVMLAATTLAQAQPLTQDATVRTGKLKNGMTYYIRHNAKEAGLADFYIAQRVGSILEEPRQRGLAHFLEHMAFNGTKNFPGKGKRLSIVPWCETVGVKFGANLNAYTSVDQTVYNISAAPIGRRDGVLDSCLLILHDWSHYLLLEDEEIDKERGVIHEEWRTRRAGMAMQRMMEAVMPTIYKGTKYEDCLPIGTMDIVDNFPYQDLRDYYQKWYRPDLQAVIVVGDVDVDRVEKKIKKLFSPIPMPKNAAERVYYPVSDNDSMIVAIERNKEQPVVLAHLYMKRDATPDAEKNTAKYLRGDYVDDLVSAMLNSRLAELRQQAEPPFMSATARASMFFVSRTKEAFTLSISCKQDNILGGIITAVAAAEQARQHGFTPEELSRAKRIQMAAAERQYNERNERRNSHYVSRCLNHFLASEPMLSADDRLQLVRQWDSDVTLDEVNMAARELITDKNQVFVLYAPEKEGIEVPTESQLRQVIEATQHLSYAPAPDDPPAVPEISHYVDSLLTAKPHEAGTIVSERVYAHGFTLLTLSNGMKVYVKATDFQADEVNMSIRGDGGTSLYGDADIPNFSLIASGTTEGGVGCYDATTLRKMLTGHVVRLSPSVGSKGQSISGTSSVKDMETMLQLTYLYFTHPRRDDQAFQGLLNRTRSFLTNRNASPKVDYNDSISAIVYGHHPRLKPVVQETLDRVSYDRILDIYRERFADASNFKAVFIGNVDLDILRPLLCKYLASLPATHQGEQTNYANIAQPVGGNFTTKFTKRMDTPLANVSIFYTADLPFTPREDLKLDFLKRVLQIAYTDSVREEKGGTYGVSVSASLDKDDRPTAMLRIAYNADPTRYDELNPIVYKQLQLIAAQGPEPSSMDKVRKYLVKQYGQVSRTNDYWSYIVWHQIEDDADFDSGYCEMVESITAEEIQQVAGELLRQGRRIEVTMLSE